MLIWIASILAMLLVAVIAIPGDVRELIVENCRRSNGRLSRRYLVREGRYLIREVWAVLNFYSGAFVFAFVAAVTLVFALVPVDSYVMPIRLVQMAASDFDPKLSQGEPDLTPVHIHRPCSVPSCDLRVLPKVTRPVGGWRGIARSRASASSISPQHTAVSPRRPTWIFVEAFQRKTPRPRLDLPTGNNGSLKVSPCD